MHSQKLLEFISKNNIIDKINCLCVDKRFTDTHNNQVFIKLDNGQQVIMPPSVNSVPALLLKQKKYTVITGYGIIINHFKEDPKYANELLAQSSILTNNGEPISYDIGMSNTNISSEKFSDFGGTNNTYGNKNFDINSNFSINAQNENYKPDKIGSDVTIENLLQQRNLDIPIINSPYGL
jgi:hypothetical protein